MPASAAAEYKLTLNHYPLNFRLEGVGGVADAEATQVRTLQLSGSSIKNVDFLVGGPALGSLAGVLGQNILHVGDVEYDLAGGAIRLFQSSGCEHKSFAYWAAGKTVSELRMDPTTPENPQTMADVTVNGVRMKAMLDTGSETSMMSQAAARRAGLDIAGPNAMPAGLSTGIGRRSLRTWILPVTKFEVGQESISNTHMRVTDVDMKGVDVILGADFFLSHRVFVANSQSRIYFTYNGGPVFNLARNADAPAGPALSSAADMPADAAAFERRGAVASARGDHASALADFDQAVRLAPTEARFLRQRAAQRAAMRQPSAALADLDAAIKLDGDDLDARLMRAQLRIEAHDLDGARGDLDVVAKSAPRQADLRLSLADLYLSAQKPEAAIGEYDIWTASHAADDSRLGLALNGRCWARALLGRDLGRALADCDAAVRLLPPRTPAPLDSRGLVRLRRGDLARAVSDYDAALAVKPRLAWSLYGRGLARLKQGKTAEGRADLAAAAAVDAHMPEEARRWGLAADSPGG